MGGISSGPVIVRAGRGTGVRTRRPGKTGVGNDGVCAMRENPGAVNTGMSSSGGGSCHGDAVRRSRPGGGKLSEFGQGLGRSGASVGAGGAGLRVTKEAKTLTTKTMARRIRNNRRMSRTTCLTCRTDHPIAKATSGNTTLFEGGTTTRTGGHVGGMRTKGGLTGGATGGTTGSATGAMTGRATGRATGAATGITAGATAGTTTATTKATITPKMNATVNVTTKCTTNISVRIGSRGVAGQDEGVGFFLSGVGTRRGRASDITGLMGSLVIQGTVA